MTSDLICKACGTPAEMDDRYCAACGQVLVESAGNTWPTAAPGQPLASNTGFIPLNLPPEPEPQTSRGRSWFPLLRSRQA